MSVAKSGISWTESTWNPIRGCSPVGAGCANCYAARQASRFAGPGLPFEGLAKGGKWTGEVRLIEKDLDQPLHWRKPRVVFVNSVSDLFHEKVTDYQISSVFDVMARCESRPGRGHVFVILTKRPARMRSWMVEQFPRLIPLGLPLANVWLGVSCWDQTSVDAMVPILLDTPAAHRVVSLEPLLGPVDPGRYLIGEACPNCGSDDAVVGLRAEASEPGRWYCRRPECTHQEGFGAWGLDQVLVGGETGPAARPCHVGWVRSIAEQCREAGVPCHVKQLGRWIAGPHDDFPLAPSMWLLSDGSRFSPPIIGPRVRERPESAVAFAHGTKADEPDYWPEDLHAAHGPGSLAWGQP